MASLPSHHVGFVLTNKSESEFNVDLPSMTNRGIDGYLIQYPNSVLISGTQLWDLSIDSYLIMLLLYLPLSLDNAKTVSQAANDHALSTKVTQHINRLVSFDFK
jgi:hypothetical protein